LFVERVELAERRDREKSAIEQLNGALKGAATRDDLAKGSCCSGIMNGNVIKPLADRLKWSEPINPWRDLL
jgi:hypothetical protein